jgi:hypothetical protein
MGTEQSIEELSLESFSDQSIEESYKQLTQVVFSSPTYRLDDLVNSVNPETLNMMSNLLDETLGDWVTENVGNESLDIVSDTLKENVSEWKDSFKGVLNVTLVRKILDNRKYWHKNITEELIRRNFDGGYTEDLAFIWLYSLKTKKAIIE